MSTATDLPADLVVKKARVDRVLGTGDTVRHRRVRVNVTDGHAYMREYDGSLTLDAKVAGASWKPGVRSFSLTTDNGEHWTVTEMGCNCGGG